LSGAQLATAVIIPIQSNAGFYRTSAESNAENSLAISLAELGFGAGDTLTFTVLGGYSNFYIEDFPSSLPDNSMNLVSAVFSSTSELLANDQQYRVPGAIEAGGPEAYVGFTYYGNFAAEIEEDFLINPALTIVVPELAAYLFIGIPDSFYSDNADLNGDLAVDVQVVRGVPEPGTLTLLACGVAAMVFGRRKKLRN
jgi:hypothetical protein